MTPELLKKRLEKKSNRKCFLLHVDFFKDIRVRRFLKACGSDGAVVFMALLSLIYSEKNISPLQYSEELIWQIADMLYLDEDKITPIIEELLNSKIFDREQFATNSILTSSNLMEWGYETKK